MKILSLLTLMSFQTCKGPFTQDDNYKDNDKDVVLKIVLNIQE